MKRPPLLVRLEHLVMRPVIEHWLRWSAHLGDLELDTLQRRRDDRRAREACEALLRVQPGLARCWYTATPWGQVRVYLPGDCEPPVTLDDFGVEPRYRDPPPDAVLVER